jgi:hypothetical protein
MGAPYPGGKVCAASPTLLQVPPPLLPSRALKVGDFFIRRRVSAAMEGRRNATVATARSYTVQGMKRLVAALAFAGALSSALAADYAPQEFDFSELGTVESVRQVPILELLPDVFEHAVKPETVDEMLIRIDDGRTVILRDETMQHFVAGERVRLVSSNRGPRVEHN